MLNEADVKKIEDFLKGQDCECGQRVDFNSRMCKQCLISEIQSIASLANRAVELPLLTDEEKQIALSGTHIDYFVDTAAKDIVDAISKAQRDLDLRTLATCKESLQVEKWQEKPTKAGWWWYRVPNEPDSVEYIAPDELFKHAKYYNVGKWYFIPEPSEGK